MGFPVDPERGRGALLNPATVPLQELAETPCLYLLGAPGLRKSTVAKDEFRRIESEAERDTAATDRAPWINLGDNGTEAKAARRLLNGPRFQPWRQGSHALHVFLDGLYESVEEVNSIAGRLAEAVEQFSPAERYRLRTRVSS